MVNKIVFNKLVDMFLSSNQLGHYDEENNSICLYDQPDKPETIKNIKTKIETITTNYKLVKNSTSNGLCNINILDIQL